jgi:hypothetical protein
MFCAYNLIAAPVANCNALKNAAGASFIVAAPFTSALFFFRVKAVYHNNTIVTTSFGLLLLSLFGISIMYPFAYKGEEHLGTTQRCIASEFARFGSIPPLITSIFDTLVFIAISLRIASYMILDNDTFGARIKSFLQGHGLPNLSRCLLQGGQLYYLFVTYSHPYKSTDWYFLCSATIGLNIVVVSMALAPVSMIYRTLFVQAHIALNNAMACRAFRGIRLGLIQEVDGSTMTSATNPIVLRLAHGSHPTKASGNKPPGIGVNSRAPMLR